MVYIYVLKLKNKKFYVGKTKNPDVRIKQHKAAKGSIWTKKNPPKKVIEVIPNCDEYDEDKITLKYMNKYGIKNVRGGSFCQSKLKSYTKKTIRQMLNSSNDACFVCGSSKHWSTKCPNNKEKKQKKLERENRCYRCFRQGHHSDDCAAVTYESGDEIIDDSDSSSLE